MGFRIVHFYFFQEINFKELFSWSFYLLIDGKGKSVDVGGIIIIQKDNIYIKIK